MSHTFTETFAFRDHNEHPVLEELRALRAVAVPGRFDYGVAYLTNNIVLSDCIMIVERKSLPDLYFMALQDDKRCESQAQSASQASSAGIPYCFLIVDCNEKRLFRWNRQAAKEAVAKAEFGREVIGHCNRSKVLHSIREMLQAYENVGWKVLLQPTSVHGHECEQLIRDLLTWGRTKEMSIYERRLA